MLKRQVAYTCASGRLGSADRNTHLNRLTTDTGERYGLAIPTA